jgi:antitoxin CcdA
VIGLYDLAGDLRVPAVIVERAKTLPREALNRAKEHGINLSRASERGVREEIQKTKASSLADDNAELAAAYTAMAEHDGRPLAKHRTF